MQAICIAFTKYWNYRIETLKLKVAYVEIEQRDEWDRWAKSVSQFDNTVIGIYSYLKDWLKRQSKDGSSVLHIQVNI